MVGRIMAAAVLAGGVVGTGEIIEKWHDSANEHGCSPVSQDSLLAAQQLLDSSPGDEINNKGLVTIREHAAQSNGLTAYNPNLYDQSLLNDLNSGNRTKSSLPFRDYFSAAKSFSAKFGIDVRISKSSDNLDYKGQVPKNEDLEDPIAKKDMVNLIQSLGAVPLEYIQMIGLKNIVLEANAKSYAAAYAKVGGPHDTIVLNISMDNEPRVLWHEEGHLFDAITCHGPQGMKNDHGFTALNGRQKYNSSSHPIPDSTHYEFVQEASDVLDAHTTKKDGLCVALEEIRHKGLNNVVFTDAYAGTNPMEDKAQLASYFPDNMDNADVFDNNTPLLEKKYAYLFARLYERDPRIARFFNTVSLHSGMTTDFFDTECSSNSTAPLLSPFSEHTTSSMPTGKQY